MKFKEFGTEHGESILLIHGLFVSWEMFIPVVEQLKERYHLIVPMLDGHIYDEGKTEPSLFTTLADQANQIADYLLSKNITRIRCLYGISLGGGVAAAFAEMGRVKVDSLILDAAPIKPLGKFIIHFTCYYQALNCWCTYHFSELYKKIFTSHYFRFSIDQVKKTYPSGGVQTPIKVYRSLFSYRLEHLSPDTQVQFWYGSKEAWVFKRCAEHLLTVRPDAQIRIFPGMQHAELVLEHPDVVVENMGA